MMRIKPIVGLLAAAAFAASLAVSPAAVAAVDIYLKLDGIAGEATASQHAGEIDVLAWSWGAASTASASALASGKTGCTNVQDLSFTHFVDKASARLIDRLNTGATIGNARLTVRTQSGIPPVAIIVLDLTGVIVTSISTGGSGGEDRLTENVTLSFGSMNYAYTPQKIDGSADAPLTATNIVSSCRPGGH